MSSSYVEVRDAENGTEENALPIAIDTCESNGIVPMNQIDGEPQKDHTYNKEPLEVQGEVEVLVSSEEAEEDMEVSITAAPEKGKRAKKQKTSPKKPNKISRSPVKKESPKKTPSSPKKKVAVKEKEKPKVVKKEEVKEESVSDSEDKIYVTLDEKDSLPAKRRGQKRKAEDIITPEKEPKVKKEKLDVKKSKATKSKDTKKEESDTSADQGQTGNDVGKTDEEKTDVKETEEKSVSKPTKKNLKTPSKAPKKTSNTDTSGDQGDSELPEGWTRKVVQRKSGKTAGQFDIYIYSPDGKKLRSRPDIAAYLAKTNSPLTINDFSFSFKQGSGPPSTPPVKPVKKSTPTPAKTVKSSPKSTTVSGKKKPAANNSKKGVRLVVKLNFSPKKRILSNYEQQEKSQKLRDTVKSEGGKKTTPKKSPAKKQTAQAKRKTTKTPSKK